MAPPRFLVVEFDGNGLPAVEWARLHPGVTMDLIFEPTQGRGDEATAQAMMLVRGMDAAASQDLESMLQRFYSPFTTTRRNGRRGEWMGRLTVYLRNMSGSPATKAVFQFGSRLGAPWSHIDGRVLHMRLRVPEGIDPEDLSRELQQQLDAAGEEAQVSVESFSRHDFSVWEDLVQASIGLRQ